MPTTRRTIRGTAVTGLLALGMTAMYAAGPAAAAGGPSPATGGPTAVRADVQAVAAAGGIGVVASVSGSSLMWTGAAGVRDIDDATPARWSDTVRVASVTKSMVATLALQEVDAGRWSLATTVGDVLPGLLPGHEGVTLEQLLSHRSGLPDYDTVVAGRANSTKELLRIIDRTWADRQLVRIALTQPWGAAPGTAFSYSNTNYIVVGLMLEKLNGSPVGTLLEQRVFRPAGMSSASFQTTKPWGQAAHLSEYAIFERPYNIDSSSPTFFSSAGAVQATARDLDRFYRALITGKLMSPALVGQMTTPRTTTPLAYGLGIYAVGDPCPGLNGQPQALFGHDGLSFGTQTLSFTSADGTRQASISWTGRQYLTTPTTGEPANDFLIDAFLANCTTAGGSPKSAAPNSVVPGLGSLPSLRSLTPADVAPTRLEN